MDIPLFIKRALAATRPQAKFIRYSHSSTFIDPLAAIGNGFHFVALYDEQIDANLIKRKGELIIIENSYLPSFGYNLLICWLYTRQQTGPIQSGVLNQLLKHNFKKYFAEQLLRYRNNIFSRAILLETLLYEQALMVPVFEAKTQDSALNLQADLGSKLMSSLVSFHELGHFFLNHNRQTWDELLLEHQAVLDGLAASVQERHSPEFFEEFQCDVIAIISCLKQYGEGSERKWCLRSIAFGFAVFAVLTSLNISAKHTNELNKDVADIVDFGGLKKYELLYDYAVGIDKPFIERARLAIEFCQVIATNDGLELFGEDDLMPLPATILEDLLAISDTIMESDDANSRAMSRLVAEALHTHQAGIDFLYMRSKVFVGATAS